MAGYTGSYISKGFDYLTANDSYYNTYYEFTRCLDYDGNNGGIDFGDYYACENKKKIASDPSVYGDLSYSEYMFVVDEYGYLKSGLEALLYPVVSLSPNIKLVGTGTKNDPYIVVGLYEWRH